MKRKIYMFFILLIASHVYAAEFQVDKSKKNMVKFISDAPVEDFEGVTNKIDGYFVYDGNELANNSELYFEVDLRTLDTGIGLRNRHMRENYLHTDKYPMTTFKGKMVKADRASSGDYNVTVEGTIFIHGVSRTLKTTGTLTPNENGYRIKSSFEVRLTDHNIEVPKLMFMKISNTMKLQLDFYLKEVKPTNTAG